ncbi:MAG: TetR/AcrR family transcriptional regulator, partial [Acidimicrobiales bacterium]
MASDLRQQRLPAARRRSQLLEVAQQLFGARGFHDTSMEDIADAAGVTKPVLYQHFPSKRDLYLELLQAVGDELLEAVTSSATAASGPQQQVRAGFDAYFWFVSERTSAFRVLFGTGARTTDEFSELVRQFEASVAGTIGSLIEAGVSCEHRELLGYAIVGLAEVTARQWLARNRTGGGGGLEQLDPAEGQRLAGQLADLVWA